MNIIADANLIVAQAVRTGYESRARAQFRLWIQRRVTISAPVLWQYETLSALRKLWVGGYLTEQDAEEAAGYLFDLGIQDVVPTQQLHAQALRWAHRLGQSAVYDATYVAAAEALGCAFWTADRRLARGARAAGADWVHDIHDLPEPAPTQEPSEG